MFGLVGNIYILGRQIKDLQDNLGGQIKEPKDDLRGLIKDMKGLTARWTDTDPHDLTIAERTLSDYGKK